MRKEEGPGELLRPLRNPREKPEQPGSGAPRGMTHFQREIAVDGVISILHLQVVSYLEVQNNRDTYC